VRIKKSKLGSWSSWMPQNEKGPPGQGDPFFDFLFEVVG